MKRVTGIGGIFFNAQHPDHLREWYAKHLGIDFGSDTAATFQWRDQEHPDRVHATIWSPFPNDTQYFSPSSKPFMINYIVEDIDAVVAMLRQEGVEVRGVDDSEYGRFAWISDPEGNRIELWGPP